MLNWGYGPYSYIITALIEYRLLPELIRQLLWLLDHPLNKGSNSLPVSITKLDVFCLDSPNGSFLIELVLLILQLLHLALIMLVNIKHFILI